MNTFATAIKTQLVKTDNGMSAHQGTGDACLDFFYSAPSARGKDGYILDKFKEAYKENKDLALRIFLWLRDVRGGAGERQAFKTILSYLINELDEREIGSIVMKIPELGRWDDMFVFVGTKYENATFEIIKHELMDGANSLCAKWMPRKNEIANKLRKFMKLSPKQYRKLLVGLTNVVETQMCAQAWDKIEFGKVPSLAHSRYKRAFAKHQGERYAKYAEGLKDGTEKINAGAVYPYDVLKGVRTVRWGSSFGNSDIVNAQWEALPNYLGDYKILPMIDLSGSMDTEIAGSTTAMEVAISLGLYTSTKLEGAFKDLYLTFSESPQLNKLRGDTILDKVGSLDFHNWGMNTDIEAAFKKILKVARDGNVDQSEMPDYLVIFSDMQFDRATQEDDTMLEMVASLYEGAGYEIPKVVFWNLAGQTRHVPAKQDVQGVGMVGGFSPSLMKSVFNGDDFSPMGIMLSTVNVDRYSLKEHTAIDF